MSKDITSTISGWDFDPERVSVRIITGEDGRDKIQLRLDLGLMQMEFSGRPDGRRPEDCESWLEVYQRRQQQHDSTNPDGAPFILESEDCALLLREGVQYYHRYISFWHLERYELCARDTNRNLRLFTFVREHARHNKDKLLFDQWRPYVTLMHSRAVATPLVALGDFETALGVIDAGIKGIEKFLADYNQTENSESCHELMQLIRWRDQVAARRITRTGSVEPQHPLTRLKEQLERAIQEERFEDAAQLRDQIRGYNETPLSPGPPRPCDLRGSDMIPEAEQLVALMKTYGSCAVALSGGVDSAVVAKAAQLALGPQALAVTGRSASLAEGELVGASEVARVIGIRHLVIDTDEFSQQDYLRNASDRCYHCKTELYSQLGSHLAEWDVEVIANGANRDDLGDYRPGLKAADEHQVRSPLVECGLDKAAVRRLAAAWELPVAEKPASPCLSSRVAYGEAVTPERLAMIDRAEQFLRGLGLGNLRVRYHRGDLARIEVSPETLAVLCEPERRESLVAEMRRLGFRYVTLDLEGFRSGSMNAALGADRLIVLQ